MEKGLVVLNSDLSGINSYMFRALRSMDWDVRVWDVGIPARLKYEAAVRSFTWRKARWKKRFHTSLLQLVRTDDGLKKRTHLCSDALGQIAKPKDIMLSFGTLFDPKHLEWTRPYAVFKDYTTTLAVRSLLPSLPAQRSDCERWMRQEGDVCRGAALVFTASENTRHSIIEDYHVPQDKVIAVGEGLCFDDVPEPNRSKEPTRNILFVGKEFERKGGPTVLRAFAKLLNHFPDVRLTVLGPEAPNRPPRNVAWPGLVTGRKHVRDYYRAADVFVMPSLTEPFGLVFLEAMAHSLPCIGSRRDAMPEIIDDGETGFLIEPGDVEDLAQKLSFLLENPATALEMGTRGYKKVTSQYLWSHVGKRMDDHLTTLLVGTER